MVTVRLSSWILGLALIGLPRLAQAQDVTSGTAIYGTAQATTNWTGGTISSGATLRLDDGGTVSGSVTNNGTLQYNESGNIAISNTVAGSGTLALGSANAIGTSSTISFGGGTLQASGNNTTDYSARFSNAASQQYKIDTNGQNRTLATALTSSGGSFTRLGAGTLTLTGANTYSGGTTISAGTLSVGSGGTSGSIVGNVIINNPGTGFSSLRFNRSDDLTYAGIISGT